MVQIQITKAMNGSLMFLAMLALGALCYWFYYKCVDWFEKSKTQDYVYRTFNIELIYIHLPDVCAH